MFSVTNNDVYSERWSPTSFLLREPLLFRLNKLKLILSQKQSGLIKAIDVIIADDDNVSNLPPRRSLPVGTSGRIHWDSSQNRGR